MRTRNLALLGIAILAAILGAALAAPKPSTGTAYVPARINVAPATVVREVTPVTYTHPEIIVNDQECGQPTTVTYPDSTDEISFEAFVTTNGYIKVVAVLSDTGRTFTQPHEGWTVAPIAPYRAEHLTPVTVTPCPEPAPETPAPAPVVETPAQEENPHGTNNCRG